MKVRFQSS